MPAGSRRSISVFVSDRVPKVLRGAIDGGSKTEVMLAQAGMDVSLAMWRARLIESGLFGGVAGALAGVVSVVLLDASPLAILGQAVMGVFAGILIRRWMLARASRTRVALMLEELPALCELMAIYLTAGTSFREALTAITEHGDGPLADNFRAALQRNSLGTPLSSALTELSSRLAVPQISRTIDHIVSSLDRGTPLAVVLRTQALEARQESGRRLQERASAREVIMLMPLIFLILPITIAFAVFPGLLVIQSGL
jgi:tight adherence protein C